MGIHVSHHPKPPSHLLPHPIPLGCPRAPTLGALFHESNLHWSSILHFKLDNCFTMLCCFCHTTWASHKCVYVCVCVCMNKYIYMYVWVGVCIYIPPSWAFTLYHSQIITECQTGLPMLHSNFPLASYFTHGSVYMWRRQWPSTPVLLPRKSHGWRSLVGCRLWGHTESDTTEAT